MSATVRAVVQRVARAEVTVGEELVADIGLGLCILVGVAHADTEDEAIKLARKLAQLRIFPNDEGKFDRSVLDVHGDVLVVSQFTLIADTTKGHRPSFAGAAPPEQAKRLYDLVIEQLRNEQLQVESGRFGARMRVELCNDGPVTVTLET